jgi:uncharacterized membrane protein
MDFASIETKILQPQANLAHKELFLRLVILLCSGFIKIVLWSVDITLSKTNNEKLASYTSIDFYFGAVLAWAFLFDLATIVMYFVKEKQICQLNEDAKKDFRQYISFGFLIQNLWVYLFFLCVYYFIYPIYPRYLVSGGRLSGHWLAIGLHNFVIVKNIVFQQKLRGTSQNGIAKAWTVVNIVILLMTYWTLIWTTLMYHTVFECAIGFLISSLGIMVFYTSYPKNLFFKKMSGEMLPGSAHYQLDD